MATHDESPAQLLQAQIQVQEGQIANQQRLEATIIEQKQLIAKWYKMAKWYDNESKEYARLNEEQAQRIGELEQTVEVLQTKNARAVERKEEYKAHVETLQELRRVRRRLDCQDEERYHSRRKHGHS